MSEQDDRPPPPPSPDNSSGGEEQDESAPPLAEPVHEPTAGGQNLDVPEEPPEGETASGSPQQETGGAEAEDAESNTETPPSRNAEQESQQAEVSTGPADDQDETAPPVPPAIDEDEGTGTADTDVEAAQQTPEDSKTLQPDTVENDGEPAEQSAESVADDATLENPDSAPAEPAPLETTETEATDLPPTEAPQQAPSSDENGPEVVTPEQEADSGATPEATEAVPGVGEAEESESSEETPPVGTAEQQPQSEPLPGERDSGDTLGQDDKSGDGDEIDSLEVSPAGESADGESATEDASDAAPGSRSEFMEQGDRFQQYARNATEDPGYHDVVVHGSPTDFGRSPTSWERNENFDHRTLADMIRRDQNYTEGTPVRLLACNSGSIDNGAAQNLANQLGAEVKAPTNTLWAFPSGRLTIGPNPTDNTGTWRSFLPGGNRERR